MSAVDVSAGDGRRVGEAGAVLCAEELGEVWRATPGATDWLKRAGPRMKPQTARRRQASSR